MKKILALVLVASALAACGVDGPPRTPAETGVTVTGDARVGVQAEL